MKEKRIYTQEQVQIMLDELLERPDVLREMMEENTEWTAGGLLCYLEDCAFSNEE